MKSYQIKHMIIDEENYGEETVTTEFLYNLRQYSISFVKSDLEVINTWLLDGESSVPAELSEHVIESIKEEVRSRI
ncbi:hypothetical protein ACFSCX_12940 [Bacillus salitolerans]|uniref:Uncharacterized protein n=1 Tax=Bacillus salitolerans TaxID=1437434 RepID=A0ABW4LQV4_9BACI